jgi:hypothetical protein
MVRRGEGWRLAATGDGFNAKENLSDLRGEKSLSSLLWILTPKNSKSEIRNSKEISKVRNQKTARSALA